jgi:hypothetical protein
MSDTALTSIISADDARAIRNALGKLRYSGAIQVPREASSVPQLLRWLEAFREELVAATDLASSQEHELQQLKADVAAMRRVLGIPAGGA